MAIKRPTSSRLFLFTFWQKTITWEDILTKEDIDNSPYAFFAYIISDIAQKDLKGFAELGLK
jgi:hypothetical protein